MSLFGFGKKREKRKLRNVAVTAVALQVKQRRLQMIAAKKQRTVSAV